MASAYKSGTSVTKRVNVWVFQIPNEQDLSNHHKQLVS